MSLNKRAAIFFWDGWISVSPSITNTMMMLSKNGYEIDCITRYPLHDFPEDVIFPEGVHIYRQGQLNIPVTKKIAETISTEEPASKISISGRIKKRLGINNLRTDAIRNKRLMSEFLEYVRFGKKITSGHNYDFVIGVDTYGLAAAGRAMQKTKFPLIYFSLEISFINDLKYLAERILKKIEKYFHRKADLTIIQDMYRLEALYHENSVSLEAVKYLIVPNAPVGKFQKINSTYFRDIFDLQENDVIILHAGGLSTGYMNNEIAASAATWPENYKLVFHFSEFLPDDFPELIKLKTLSNHKALISPKPVAFDKLAEISSSAQIGIVFYNKDRGLNHSLIVGASGKLANYLRCGLPVIALNLPGFKELFDKYGCGVVVDSAEENAKAIETIMSDYKRYSENAARCYDEVYEFESHFNQLFPALENIVKNKGA